MCRVRALGSRAAGEKMGVSWLVDMGRSMGKVPNPGDSK